jgi:hypothetical protein
MVVAGPVGLCALHRGRGTLWLGAVSGVSCFSQVLVTGAASAIHAEVEQIAE